MLHTPPVLLSGALGLAQTFVRGAVYVIVVVFVVEAMGLDNGAVGLLLGAIGVGAMLGLPFALGIVGRQRLYRAYGAGLALWGLPLVLSALVPQLGVVLLLFALVGLGNDLVDVSLFSAVPRAVPDRVLAQVFGVFETLFQIGMALGALAAGVLLVMFDSRVALLAVGLVLPVLAALVFPVLRRFDAGLEHRDVEVDLLRRQPLFEMLAIPVLDNLAARLERAELPSGTVIMTEGDSGDRYVLIADGTVSVRRGGAEIAVMGSGGAFGEIALLRDTPRNATVVATSAVSVRTLDRESFVAALGCDPRARTAAEAIADARSAP